MTKSKHTGRPGGYSEALLPVVVKACAQGATDEEIAQLLGVSTRTVYRWAAEHAKFRQALKVGKDAADDRVERSLFNRAVGYSFDSEKIVTVSDGKDGSHIERIPIVEHVPPDTTAQIFWLKNRRKDAWRDKQDIEHTGKDGGPIETNNKHDMGASIAFALRKASKT